ncbi:MAG: general secretion pathway protein GspB [Pseudomonadota bacterium]
MSTILDALKKSEQERKLNKLPTLSDMPAPEEPRRWPQMVIIALLLLVVALLAWLSLGWLEDRSTTNPADQHNIVVDNDSVGAPNPLAQQGSGDIIVNVVSYSEQPEQRFVMINGKLYREGEFVRAGLMIERITPESVVMIDRGRRVERQP